MVILIHCDICGTLNLKENNYCTHCGNKLIMEHVCPYCGEEVNMEIGPDDVMPEEKESARLLQMIEGEDVEKYDTLLSLAITGGDYGWI